jgi:hypothetical protein
MTIIKTQAQLYKALKADINARLDINAGASLLINISAGAPVLQLFGNTILYLEARDNSQPHVMARDNSRPRVEARDNSQPHVVARDNSQPRVVAQESSQPRVEARGSSQPHVEAWGNSQPRVVAWGSSQPRVEAQESSQPRVEAWAYAQVSLFGKRIKATASANVAVLLHAGATAEGGHQITVKLDTPAEWCEYYGVELKDGVAILYKALNGDFTSPYGASYAPGTVPLAPDWDGGARECGGGLHFSSSPMMAMSFHESAVKFAGCPVALSDIVVHPEGQFPEKVKARGCCGPCFEVDGTGKPIVAVTEATS